MPLDIQADLEGLYAAIIQRTTGKQVSQAGHKDKSASYAQATLKEMLHLYRSLWTKESGLPDLKDLDQNTTRRGRAAVGYLGGRSP
jgi:hypothetical protein